MEIVISGSKPNLKSKEFDNNKKFAFLSGLPRSGSTLLSSILNQNPNIHSGANSPMCGMIFNLERSILLSEQWAAYPKPEVMPKVITGVLEGFYSDIQKPIILDKSREWSIPHHFEVLKRNLGYDPKIIMPVRSIVSILTSFIDLVHRNPLSVSFMDKEIEALQQFNFYREPDEIRCDHLMRPKGLIDNCIYGIHFALMPENKKYFHFIEYDNLIDDTETEIKKIYDFLELDYFNHDYKNIINVVHEDDSVFGLKGMHDIRNSVSRRYLDPKKILSKYVIDKYSNLEIWRDK